jgi:hypothetical protein
MAQIDNILKGKAGFGEPTVNPFTNKPLDVNTRQSVAPKPTAQIPSGSTIVVNPEKTMVVGYEDPNKQQSILLKEPVPVENIQIVPSPTAQPLTMNIGEPPLTPTQQLAKSGIETAQAIQTLGGLTVSKPTDNPVVQFLKGGAESFTSIPAGAFLIGSAIGTSIYGATHGENPLVQSAVAKTGEQVKQPTYWYNTIVQPVVTMAQQEPARLIGMIATPIIVGKVIDVIGKLRTPEGTIEQLKAQDITTEVRGELSSKTGQVTFGGKVLETGERFVGSSELGEVTKTQLNTIGYGGKLVETGGISASQEGGIISETLSRIKTIVETPEGKYGIPNDLVLSRSSMERIGEPLVLSMSEESFLQRDIFRGQGISVSSEGFSLANLKSIATTKIPVELGGGGGGLSVNIAPPTMPSLSFSGGESFSFAQPEPIFIPPSTSPLMNVHSIFGEPKEESLSSTSVNVVVSQAPITKQATNLLPRQSQQQEQQNIQRQFQPQSFNQSQVQTQNQFQAQGQSQSLVSRQALTQALSLLSTSALTQTTGNTINILPLPSLYEGHKKSKPINLIGKAPIRIKGKGKIKQGIISDLMSINISTMKYGSAHKPLETPKNIARFNRQWNVQGQAGVYKTAEQLSRKQPKEIKPSYKKVRLI